MQRDRPVLSSAPRGAWIAAAVFLLAGCSTTAPKREPSVFFPPSPELPHIQFLTAFTGSKDVEEQSGFDRFVVGEKVEVKLDKPYGVAFHDGRLYVCDTNAGVIVFDFNAKRFEPLKGAAAGPGRLLQPVNIWIEPDGTKYVTDPARAQVVVYDHDDGYVKAYGFEGSWRPVDAVPFDDRLYVADYANSVVRVFDKASGEPRKTIGDRGEKDERLSRPTNVAFSPDGELYVSDFARFQVVKYDRDGHFKAAIGKLGDNLGHFARPKGIALDRKGRLFAADASFNNIQVFNKDGRLLLFFGGAGEKRGDLLLPAKIAIDYDGMKYFQRYVDPGFDAEGLIFVTSQFGPRRVNVYAFGKEKGRKYPTEEELLRQIEERRKKELAKAPPASVEKDKPAGQPEPAPSSAPPAP